MTSEDDVSPAPALLFAPVHHTAVGCVSLRTAHRPDGTRVGLAFTTPEAMATAMGRSQPSAQLTEQSLRGMLRPLGIDTIIIDSELVAPCPKLPNLPASRGVPLERLLDAVESGAPAAR
jgi:hypothetical protein